MASELKIASAFFFESRSPSSSSDASGRPRNIALTRATARPRPVVEAWRPSQAVRQPLDEAVGEAGLAHRDLDGVDVVRRAVPRAAFHVGVEDPVAGGRGAVA